MGSRVVGAGKTVSVRTVLAGLDLSKHTVIYLPNPMIGVRGIHEEIVNTFGQHVAHLGSRLMVQAGKAVVAEREESGRTPVLVCEAARLVIAAFPDTRIMIVNWWDVVGETFRNTLARETGVARSDDHHTGMVESSLVMHNAPDATHPDLADTDPAGLGPRRFRYHVFPLPTSAVTTSGIVYTARKASADIGRRVADQVARAMASAVRLELGADIDSARV